MSSGWKVALASATTALAATGAACATVGQGDERSHPPASAAATIEWGKPGGTAVQEFEEPQSAVEDAAVGHLTPPPRPNLTVLDGVLERNQGDLLAIDGVTAVWTGPNASGADAVFVAVTDTAARDRVPQEVEGHPVEVVVVPGGFVPQAPDG